MNIHSVCRGCLKEDNLSSIFDEQNIDTESVKYSHMFATCTSLTVDEFDGHPVCICAHCLNKLKSAYIFRLQCIKSFECIVNNLKNINLDNDTKEIIANTQDFCDRILENVDLPSIIKDEDDEEKCDYVDDQNDDHKEDSDVFYCYKENSFENTQDEGCEENTDEVKAEVCEKGKRKVKKYKKKVKEVLKCQHCDKMFKKRCRLLAHEDTHFGVKRYFCEMCNKAYRSEKDHKNVHKRGLNFKCDVCNKCFGTKTKLTIHLNTHKTDRKVFTCGLDGCNKQFVTEGGLQKHRELHDGFVNLVCHVCSNKYRDKYSLQLHIRRHYNDKKFQCSYCDKKFYSSSAKTQHEYRHMNKRNYPCPNCDHRCYNSAALKKHMLTHTKVLNEECRFCFKRFSRRDNRKQHERTVHKLAKNEGKNDDVT